MMLEKKHRIFFALWPDDDVRRQIVERFEQAPQSKMKGRLMRPENLHITLHFIGGVSSQKFENMHCAAQTVINKTFHLTLDHYGHFYKAKVFWMGLKNTPPGLKQLHENLGEALAECNYHAEARHYAPHITLMRKLLKPGELFAFEPIEWPVKDFVLVESIPVEGGVKYEVVQRYPLG